MTNIAMEAPIEIDGLPIKNGGSFHGYVSHNQMVISLSWGDNRYSIFRKVEQTAMHWVAGSNDMFPWSPWRREWATRTEDAKQRCAVWTIFIQLLQQIFFRN